MLLGPCSPYGLYCADKNGSHSLPFLLTLNTLLQKQSLVVFVFLHHRIKLFQFDIDRLGRNVHFVK
jgi:hypothetical protein